MLKQNRKIRLVKFGLPIAILLAIAVGIFSFPDVGGAYSPYVSLAIIYFFDDWSLVNTGGYIALFALIQFFIIAFVISIIVLKYTFHKNRKLWWSGLCLNASMVLFVLTFLFFIFWITSGLFGQYVENDPSIASADMAYIISYGLPALILLTSLISLIIWLNYYLPKIRLRQVRQKFNYRIFQNHKIPWSGKDHELKIICIIGLLVASLEIILTAISIWLNNNDVEIYTNVWLKIWFGTMHHFTELSNLWVAIFFAIFLLNYRFKFLKTSAYVTITMVYISATFLIADFLLAPFMILNHSSGYINMGFGGLMEWWDWIKTTLFHVVQPIIMLIFFIFFCKSQRHYYPWKFHKILIVTMIFPVLYLIYAVIINFMPIPHLQKVSTDASPTLIYGGISIYGYFTCINPSIHANVFNLNNNPVWSGKLINISWYVVALVLFLGLGSYYNWIERHTMIVKHLISTKQYTPRLNWK